MKKNAIPTFTPPGENKPNNIPRFTPPKGNSHSGAVCFHHRNEPAAGRCSRCGKNICSDCVEAYTVTSGEYKDKCLCYDCCQQIVSDNIAELNKNKRIIKRDLLISVIGIIIGYFLGIQSGISSSMGLKETLLMSIVYAGVGGMFLSVLKAFGTLTIESLKSLINGEHGIGVMVGHLLGMVVIVFKSVWYTIKNTYEYLVYLKKTEGFIRSDSEALQMMKDYMEFTLIRSENSDFDLDNLMSEGNVLQGNLYAREFRASGEARADETLRHATTRIAENGEIIRDFPRAA